MGGTAAAISKTGAAPIERVKLMIQNQGAMIAAGRLGRPYAGIVDCFKRTYAEEGLLSCGYSSLYSAALKPIILCDSLEKQRNECFEVLPDSSPQFRLQRHL